MALGERAFKKALHTRAHRERSQPSNRTKLGLLEKHKDYVERARDYHAKERQIKGLRIKASQRNPDEFHHGMIRARQIVLLLSLCILISVLWLLEWRPYEKLYRGNKEHFSRHAQVDEDPGCGLHRHAEACKRAQDEAT